MFSFIRKKDHDNLKHQYDQVVKERDNLKNKIDVLVEDNQILTTTNDYYIKKYDNAKNIIRLLNNDIPGNVVIPEKCPNCNITLIYNENLHIASCTKCNTFIKNKEDIIYGR